MATTLTTSWQTIKTATTSYTYEGLSFTWTIALQARYSNQSGNTATVRLRAVITNSSAQAWYGTNKGYNINGNGYVAYTSTVNGGASFTTTEYTAGTLNGGASASVWGQWTVMNTYQATASETVVMPAFIVAPAMPTLSVESVNAKKNVITYGLSSFGNPASGSVELRFSTSPTATTGTKIAEQTTTGQWTYNHTNRTARTTYYYWVVASNGSATTTTEKVSVTTRPALYAPSASNKTKLVQSLLVPHNGLSKYVIKLYRGNANNEAERIF